MSNLSPLQRMILKWLLSNVRHAEQHNRQLLKDGFHWTPQWKRASEDTEAEKSRENVWRVSLSRSLARLEKRGFVARIKGSKSARTVRVKLTRKGRDVAEVAEAGEG